MTTSLEAIKSALAATTTDVTTIRKIQANKYQIVQSGTDGTVQIGTIYDDDGSSTFKQFKITLTPGTNKKVIEWL